METEQRPLKTGPETPAAERSFPATLENIPHATAFIRQKLDALACPPKARMDISIVIDEIMSNIAFYAYGAGGGEVTVRFEALSDPRGAMLTFIDTGITYNPLEAPEPDVTLGTRERKPGGLGIFLVRKKVDRVTYEHVDGRNILRITKYF